MKTPQEIAADIYWTATDAPTGPAIRALIVAGIEADRAQRADTLARVRAMLDAEIVWETPAVLKDRIEWALRGENARPRTTGSRTTRGQVTGT